jgi:hypothetical protein
MLGTSWTNSSDFAVTIDDAQGLSHHCFPVTKIRLNLLNLLQSHGECILTTVDQISTAAQTTALDGVFKYLVSYTFLNGVVPYEVNIHRTCYQGTIEVSTI